MDDKRIVRVARHGDLPEIIVLRRIDRMGGLVGTKPSLNLNRFND